MVLELPHFASLRGRQRELVVLRSESGESWKEHHWDQSQEELQLLLSGLDEGQHPRPPVPCPRCCSFTSFCSPPAGLDPPEELDRKRLCRIVSRDFPQFFAVVSRVRQDSHLIGPEGGVLSSTLVPQVQAVFPEGALTKRIRVGLQVGPRDGGTAAPSGA